MLDTIVLYSLICAAISMFASRIVKAQIPSCNALGLAIELLVILITAVGPSAVTW